MSSRKADAWQWRRQNCDSTPMEDVFCEKHTPPDFEFALLP